MEYKESTNEIQAICFEQLKKMCVKTESSFDVQFSDGWVSI